MQTIGHVAPASDLGIQVTRSNGRVENARSGGLDARLWPPAVKFADILAHGTPPPGRWASVTCTAPCSSP